MIVTKVLHLHGAYAGKTIKLGNFEFVDGVIELSGNREEVEKVAKFLGRNWQAFPLEDENHGEHNVHGEIWGEARDNEASSDVQSEGQESFTPSTQDNEPIDEAKTRTEIFLSHRDGQEDAGVPDEQVFEEQSEDANTEVQSGSEAVNEKLKKVIESLDPSVDEHWTKAGLPSISAVCEAYESNAISRADIEDTAPGFNREMASLNQL